MAHNIMTFVRRSSAFWPVLVSLVVLALAPAPVLAHSGGGGHGHSGKSKAVAVTPGTNTGMYRWTDDRGQVHYTQGLHSIPERFRSDAVRLGNK